MIPIFGCGITVATQTGTIHRLRHVDFSIPDNRRCNIALIVSRQWRYFHFFFPLVFLSLRNLSRTLAKLYYRQWQIHSFRSDVSPDTVDTATALLRCYNTRDAETHCSHLCLFQYYLWSAQDWQCNLSFQLWKKSKRMVYSLLSFFFPFQMAYFQPSSVPTVTKDFCQEK